MKMIWIYLITLGISVFLAKQAGTGRVMIENGYYHVKKMNLWVILLILFLYIISGFRFLDYLYSDEWIYRHAGARELTLQNVFRTEGLEIILEYLSNCVFTSRSRPFADGQFYILVSSAVIVYFMVKSIWIYSEDFPFSIFLFITMGYFTTSMNIIRQYIAVSILFYSYRYLIEGNFKKYLIGIFFAAGFHSTSLIMLPLYFIVRQKSMNKLGFLAVLVGIVFMSRIENIGATVLENTKYADYILDPDAKSVNIIRFLSAVIPCVLVWLFRKRILHDGEEGACEFNLNIFTILVWIASLSNLYYNRISPYFSFICLLTFPKIPCVTKGGVSRFIKFAIVLLYFVFGLYQHSIMSNYHNILFERISGPLLPY